MNDTVTEWREGNCAHKGDKSSVANPWRQALSGVCEPAKSAAHWITDLEASSDFRKTEDRTARFCPQSARIGASAPAFDEMGLVRMCRWLGNAAKSATASSRRRELANRLEVGGALLQGALALFDSHQLESHVFSG